MSHPRVHLTRAEHLGSTPQKENNLKCIEERFKNQRIKENDGLQKGDGVTLIEIIDLEWRFCSV